MFGTTDHPMFWRPQFGDPLTQPAMYEANSPHRHIARSARRCWSSTATRTTGCRSARRCGCGGTCPGTALEAKFLYFPDENHWILTPGNARIWYETVFAFLAQHVLGQEWRRPALL